MVRRACRLFVSAAVSVVFLASCASPNLHPFRPATVEGDLADGVEPVEWFLPAPLENFDILDLGHSLNDSNPFYPSEGMATLRAEEIASLMDGGHRTRLVTMPELFGTHVSAPRHVVPSGQSVAEIVPIRLIRPGVVIDLGQSVFEDPDSVLSLEAVLDWERENGRIETGAVVLLRTGWSARFGLSDLYLNLDRTLRPHYPGFGIDAVRFLVDERSVAALGIDTLSVDPGAAKDQPVHRFGSEQGIFFIHNLTRLDELPKRGFMVWTAPLKLDHGSGGPARVFALIGS